MAFQLGPFLAMTGRLIGRGCMLALITPLMNTIRRPALGTKTRRGFAALRPSSRCRRLLSQSLRRPQRNKVSNESAGRVVYQLATCS